MKAAADAPSCTHERQKGLQPQIFESLLDFFLSVDLGLNRVPSKARLNLQRFLRHKKFFAAESNWSQFTCRLIAYITTVFIDNAKLRGQNARGLSGEFS